MSHSPFHNTQIGPDGKRYPLGSIPTIDDFEEPVEGTRVGGEIVEVEASDFDPEAVDLEELPPV